MNRWFDTWQWTLTLISTYLFFGFIFPIPAIYLNFLYYPYGHLWLVMWMTVAVMLAYHEVKRRNRAMLGAKWFYNPNAVDEYLKLIKKND